MIEMTAKKFMYINRRAPHGSCRAQEGLEVALVGAAFDQHVSLAFIDDGVFLLKRDADTAALGIKNFAAAYRALGDFDVKNIYVERESLAVRGLVADDLLNIRTDPADDNSQSLIEIVDAAALADLIEAHDVLLNF